MTVFRASNNDPEPNYRALDPEAPEHLIPMIQAWVQRDTNDGSRGNLAAMRNRPMVVPIQDKAADTFEGFGRASAAKKRAARDGTGMDALWARAEEQAKKVALIIACGNELAAPAISNSVAQYSCDLIEYLLKDLIRQVGENVADSKYGRDKLKLLAFIRDAGPDGTTTTKICRTMRGLPRSMRDQMISDLVDEQRIDIRDVVHEGSGRPGKRFFAISSELIP